MDRKYVIAIAVCATVIVVIIVIVVVVVALLIRRRRSVVRVINIPIPSPANCRRKSNDEDNPPGTTDGPGSTVEDAEKKDVYEEIFHADEYLFGDMRDDEIADEIYGYDDRDEEVSLPLTVHQTPCQVLGKGIELVLQNQEVMFGDSATFRLRLRDDTGEAGEWTRDDVTLTHSEKTQISINGRDRQLTLTDVHPPDTGEYAYRVGEDMTSAHLSINKANCFISVQHPPPPPIIPI